MRDIYDKITVLCFVALFPIGISGFVRHDYTALIGLGIVCAFSIGATREWRWMAALGRCRSRAAISLTTPTTRAIPLAPVVDVPAYVAPRRYAYTRRISIRRLIRLLRRGVAPRMAAGSARPLCVTYPPRVANTPRSSERCASGERRPERGPRRW